LRMVLLSFGRCMMIFSSLNLNVFAKLSLGDVHSIAKSY
jgi:hypothetical protein